MKYRNGLYGGIFLLFVVGITIILCICTGNISNTEPIDYIILIVPITIIIVSLTKIAKSKQIMKNGDKLNGYIIDVECVNTNFLYNKSTSGALKLCINGKITRIDNIEINGKYKKLYDKINSMYYVDENINIKGIPVDIYIDNGQVYVDLESIEV